MTAVRVAAGEAALTSNSEADPADQPWSHTDMLLASIIDAIHSLQWTYAVRYSERRPKHPEPVRRPGVKAGHRGDRSTMTAGQYRMLTGQSPPLYLIQGGG